jgi:two-component system, NarL family, nitrate/nitrite response regulator NarL
VTAVLVVGSVRFFRDGLAMLLSREPGIDVVGSAAAPEDAVESARSLDPDVILVDLAMEASIGTVRALGDAAPRSAVVVLSVPDRERDILACAEAGIAGFVTREASFAELVSTVENVARGEMPMSPRLAATLLRRIGALSATHDGAAATLTRREREVAEFLREGLSNKEIAARLSIEVATVKNHVHNILDKLRLQRRGEVASAVRTLGRLGDAEPVQDRTV